MIYQESENKWITTLTGSEIEVNLSGSPQEVRPINLEIFSYVEANLDALITQSIEYIQEFVNDRSGISGNPEVQFIDIGLNEWGEHTEFEIFFTTEADYVLWGVRYSYNMAMPNPSLQVVPFTFSRRKW